jgi:transmembrane 9 superfamily member 2/4
MIMVRTLRRDIARYNQDEGPDEAVEETGWKLVHGDVFRPPRHPRLFAAVLGSGIQIFLMALITICTLLAITDYQLINVSRFAVFAMLGMLSPASRGALATAAIFCYVFMGLIAGYFSARIYKTMKGKEWKRAAFLVIFLTKLTFLAHLTKILTCRPPLCTLESYSARASS